MVRIVRRAVVAGGGLLLIATPLAAQGYQLRLDTRFSSVAYRGYAARTIAADEVISQPDGRLTTPDGITVRCPTGATTCTYLEPGAELEGSPLVSTVDAAAWGFGVPGLRVRTKARVGADLQDPDVWPGQAPAVHLLEGYLEYANRLLTVQAGRTYEFSRLGFTGLDGGKLDLRPFGGTVYLSAYGGWGLARGAPLPLTSPEVNPLNEFRPGDRQAVAGGSVGWAFSAFEGRVVYQREVDPRDTLAAVLASERGAVDMALRPMIGVTLAGGAEYDFARGEWGTADARLTLAQRSGRLQLSVGGRHYRPYFDLWTIWGAFSPVPYTGGFGTVRVAPLAGIALWTQGEFFSYDETGADTVLVRVADDGWRWTLGATVARLPSWTFDATYHVDKGPGASSLGLNGRVLFHPREAFMVSAEGGYLSRPLEFRFNDTKLSYVGLRASVQPASGVRVQAGGRFYDELRERGDAAELDWSQLRLDLGVTLTFRSAAERPSIHPAILRIPEGGAR